MTTSWVFTFGNGHEHPNGYVVVKDATFDEARAIMFAKHGCAWSMVYPANAPETIEMINLWGMRLVDTYRPEPSPAGSTHWHAFTDTDLWEDNPVESPERAAEAALKHEDEGWDLRDTLTSDGEVAATVHGYELTTDAPTEERPCAEYTPGMEWFRPTGETKTVRIRVTYQVQQ